MHVRIFPGFATKSPHSYPDENVTEFSRKRVAIASQDLPRAPRGRERNSGLSLNKFEG